MVGGVGVGALFYWIAIAGASSPYLLDVLRGNGNDFRVVGIPIAIFLDSFVVGLALSSLSNRHWILRCLFGIFLPAILIVANIFSFFLLRLGMAEYQSGTLSYSVLQRVLSFNSTGIAGDSETILRGSMCIAVCTASLVLSGLLYSSIQRFFCRNPAANRFP
jgi:hypothetical protein